MPTATKAVEKTPSKHNPTKTAGLLRVDPRNIIPEKDFNVRFNYKGIEDLMANILENGVKVPLRGYKKDKNEYVLTDGYRRHRAVTMLIKAGNDIKYVPFILEPKDYNQQQRIVDIFTLNQHEGLSDLEKAQIFKRLINFGWKEEDVGKKIGRTQAYVSHILKLDNFPQYLKNCLKEELLSTSVAIEVMKNHDEKDHKAVVKKSLEEMKRLGRSKITAKQVASKTQKPPKRQTRHQKLFLNALEIMKDGDTRTYTVVRQDKVKTILKALESKTAQGLLNALMKVI